MDGSTFHFLAREGKSELILCSLGFVRRPTSASMFSFMSSEGSKLGARIQILGGTEGFPTMDLPLSAAEKRFAIGREV